MCHSDSKSLEESNCDEASLAVFNAHIFYGHGVTIKESRHIEKVNSMVTDI